MAIQIGGKSQICHTLCAMAKQPISEGGLDGGVIYIDTEGTFRPERLQQIAESRGFIPLEVLKNVTVCKVYNSSHLELIIKDIGKYINEFKAKLVIVDSIVSLHRAEFAGRGTLADRQQRLNSILHKLVRVTEIYNVTIIITNQVQTSPDSFFGDPTKAAGGNVIGHTSTYRIYLRKSGENRIAKMIDSPYHPYSDTRFTINQKGIYDLQEGTNREKKLDGGAQTNMSEIDSSSEIKDLMNPTDELKKKIVAVASTIREWNNETARVRKTVKKQFEEIRNLGLNKYKMENAALRKLVEDIFRIHGVSDSWLRKLLPVELKDTKKTRLSYLQKQEIEKEQRLLLSQQPLLSESRQKSESKEYSHHYSCTADPASYQSMEQELTLSSSNIQQGSETRHALENDSLDHETLSLPSRESVTIQNEPNEANKRIEKLKEDIRWLSEPFVAKAYLQNEYQDIPLVAQIDPVEKVIISIQIDKSY